MSNGFYEQNVNGDVNPNITPDKQGLLNGDQAPEYTPLANSTPAKTHNAEYGSPQEKDGLLPVQLGPGWEDKKLPEDELNFKNISSSEDSSSDGEAPYDKFKLVYFILLLHGIGTLMPWNMFITAQSYFVDYKLNTTASQGTEYAANFLSYVGIAAQVPNVILNGVNLFCQCGGGSLGKRIVWSIIVVILCFILTVILAIVDSSEWPGLFFGVTMGTVVVINMANGIYQNCVYGTAAILPMKYTNAVVLGSNISGTITSLIFILSIATSPNLRTSAIYYFISAIFVLLLAFDTYFALPLLKFYRFYKKKAETSKNVSVEEGEVAISSPPPYFHIFKQTFKQMFSIFFTFFVTLTIFPAIQADVKKSDPAFFIPDEYFTPVTCFLFFNAFAVLGNLTTEWVRKPGPKYLWIAVLIRGVIAIPFFMLCNYRPATRSFPAYISGLWGDYVYMVGGILMALTSGYFSSLGMMYAPRTETLDTKHAGVAAMMSAFFLVLGIMGGVWFSLAVAKFVEGVGPGPM
ncbi:unnamed protein product [Owenia fusiformis]|uniref:Uncharacterized protein n=1 Tax=Owenia fusiformis TaxID=6347 RepID=A0A8J1XGS1_OWEFU|nr:unnamed protein product [Owenia fusiformis]